MFIDTHLHLSNNDDISNIVKEAKENDTSILIISGCDKEGIEDAISIIEEYDNIYATIGYHPSEVGSVDASDLIDLEKKILGNKKIVGLGEIGLDYHYEGIDRERQKELFIKQLDIAERLKVPVVIHSRDAFLDTYQILSKYKLRGIIHCFSGSRESAELFIKLGYLLGIGGVVTFKNSKLSEVLKEIPIENLVLETDSPYLSPIRGEQNAPKNVKLVAKKLSEIYNMNIDNIAKITSKNTVLLFDLDVE